MQTQESNDSRLGSVQQEQTAEKQEEGEAKEKVKESESLSSLKGIPSLL